MADKATWWLERTTSCPRTATFMFLLFPTEEPQVNVLAGCLPLSGSLMCNAARAQQVAPEVRIMKKDE